MKAAGRAGESRRPGFAGPAGDAVDAAARQHLREAALDVQAVRHQRGRLHQPGRARRGGHGRARADGPQAPRDGGAAGTRAARQGLPEARPQSGRRHHHRGVHGELPQGR